jgi:hypothetical protein
MSLGQILQIVLTYFVKPSHILTGMVGQTPTTLADKPIWIRLLFSKLTPLLILAIVAAFAHDPDLDQQLTDMACEMNLITCTGDNLNEDID